MTARSWTYLAILLALMFHGALLPFTYGQTYDSYIHMFFGNHYLTSWFDPWETRWYTGFTVTAYPPGSHQALGILMRFMDMRIAFIALQLLAIGILIIGVFRFSRLWVNDKAASYAAMLCAFSTSISETLHIFGQLPTLLSIALFLNAIPHISSWIEHGRKRDFILGLFLTAATTSVHHVTPLFGTVFFVAPIGIAALLANLKRRELYKPSSTLGYLKWISPALIRGFIMGLGMLFLIITIVFPYWHWSITDPITQVSIPHGSRENFIAKPNLGLMFFVIPWGMLITVVPYVILKSARTALWPLGLSVLIALFLGTGGTTPLPRILLGPAFEILTLDRFTFWASILILPFAGLAVQSLWEGRGKILINRAFGSFLSRAFLVLTLVTYVGFAVGTALLPTFRPTQPDFIDPAPIVTFMDEDRHSDWRYLTLGFGDQFAYHSALINAESVDGNYHSARRLPSLMNYSVERLENSKYMGVPGLASLNQFLTNAEKFHLKYVFSNDEFYDPVLHYTGWNPVTRLNNGIRVWEKPDISPLPIVRPRRDLPRYQKLMWGILPIGSLILGLLTLIGLALRQQLISSESRPFLRIAPSPYMTVKVPEPEPTLTVGVATQLAPLPVAWTPPKTMTWLVRVLPLVAASMAAILIIITLQNQRKPLLPETVVERFYQHLDFRETEQAFSLLASDPDLDYGQFLKMQKLTGGLVPSFGKLTSVEPLNMEVVDDGQVRIKLKLIYLTSIGIRPVITEMTLIQNANKVWQIKYEPADKTYTPNLTSSSNAPQFRDLTGQKYSTSMDPVQRLARPEIELMATEVIEDDGRLFVIGRLKNLSEFPACTKVLARAVSTDSEAEFKQHAGRIGPHRLLPGESSAFRVDFEGYLKIQDQPFNAAYNPDEFSVPEFDSLPSDIDVSLSTTVCTPAYYKSVAFSEINISEMDGRQALTLKVSNIGTEIVSTLQLKLSYVDAKGRLTWVEPYYLQNNLIPGEVRVIQIPLSVKMRTHISSPDRLQINGESSAINLNSIWPTGAKLANDDMRVMIDYDAMLYRPLD
ncbi:hypothetical protein [Litorimonas cladophorae]|nr:hypothetical protein [Litorimonas cladophorae]